MSEELKVTVRIALEREALEQRDDEVTSLKKRVEELSRMDPVQYVRKCGLDNLCPKDFSKDVLGWLGISDNYAHFSVRADSGNEGTHLEVSQGHAEWDNVRDPWEEK